MNKMLFLLRSICKLDADIPPFSLLICFTQIISASSVLAMGLYLLLSGKASIREIGL